MKELSTSELSHLVPDVAATEGVVRARPEHERRAAVAQTEDLEPQACPHSIWLAVPAGVAV